MVPFSSSASHLAYHTVSLATPACSARLTRSQASRVWEGVC